MLPGGQVTAGAPPGSSMTIGIAALVPWKLADGQLTLLASPGAGGSVTRHAGQLVERLAALGHSVASIAVTDANDLEREFARELVDTAAR